MHLSSNGTHNSAHISKSDTHNSALFRKKVPLNNSTSPYPKPTKLLPPEVPTALLQFIEKDRAIYKYERKNSPDLERPAKTQEDGKLQVPDNRTKSRRCSIAAICLIRKRSWWEF